MPVGITSRRWAGSEAGRAGTSAKQLAQEQGADALGGAAPLDASRPAAVDYPKAALITGAGKRMGRAIGWGWRKRAGPSRCITARRS